MELTDIKGIGSKRLHILESNGICDALGLLRFFPQSYMDYNDTRCVRETVHGENAALCLTIVEKPRLSYPRKGLSVVTCRALDNENKSITLTWFNQPYRAGANVLSGRKVYAFGRVSRQNGTRLISPAVYSENPGLIPLYKTKGNISSSVLSNIIGDAIKKLSGNIAETLPQSVIEKYSLMPAEKAFSVIHFPQNKTELEAAQRRFAFEDMLHYKILLNVLRLKRAKAIMPSFDMSGVYDDFVARLPFELTVGQREVIKDIEADLSSTNVMNRLIQGDVGSGKTVLSIYAMMAAQRNGFQSALLAPTEILARQHYDTLKKLLGGTSVCLLTGSTPAAEKTRIYENISQGEIDYIIGTHALLQAPVEFSKLGLIVCDEQQRFGVKQRAVMEKKGELVNVLVMTATPIPRTLALTMFGDLDISALREMPKGRTIVKTQLVPQNKRYAMYDYIAREAAGQGKQAYVVCPLIENEDDSEMESVIQLHGELTARLHVRVGLLHGKMRSKEKERVISDFRSGEISILVSTTVIEVGVDVPTAAIMVIENAERFGLSQLHQLRGRVGRGNIPGRCFLVASNDAENERLNVLTETFDGFTIAEQDLRLRGPGSFLGAEQHGMPELSMMRYAQNMELLEEAVCAANGIFGVKPLFDGAELVLNAALARYKLRLENITLN